MVRTPDPADQSSGRMPVYGSREVLLISSTDEPINGYRMQSPSNDGPLRVPQSASTKPPEKEPVRRLGHKFSPSDSLSPGSIDGMPDLRQHYATQEVYGFINLGIVDTTGLECVHALY